MVAPASRFAWFPPPGVAVFSTKFTVQSYAQCCGGGDASRIRRMIAAAEAVEKSQAELRAAVAATRPVGARWDAFGVAFGDSRHAGVDRIAG